MAFLNVETATGDSALQTYGHTFSDIEEARDYLERHGGGTIVIVPDNWDQDIYPTDKWQADFDYECDREVLIVVEDKSEEMKELNAVITAGEADEIYGLGAGTARQACHRGQIKARKSGGTWLIRREDAEAMWGKKPEVIQTLKTMKDALEYLKAATTLSKPAGDLADVERIIAEGRLVEMAELAEAARQIVRKVSKAPNHFYNQVRDTEHTIKHLRGYLTDSQYDSPYQFFISLNETRTMISYAYELMSK